MDKPKILIVEDEEKIARVLELELTYEGYEVGKALDGLDGFRLFQEQSWDLILLDVMLPGISGIELLRRIRAHDPHTMVVMLTAKDSVEDKVSGLDLGANDYVTKPFQMEELLARIRASLRMRRLPPAADIQPEWITVADLSLSELTHEVKRGEDRIELTPREFGLLAYLMKHARQVLSREQLLDGVWGYDYYGDTNIVEVYIRYLRHKVDKPYETPLIHTVRGVGYVLRDPR
ncbi:MAG: response regulator transcription factor [Paenibacillus dendritiformis]|uniref:response regulator transcription factor n=1 Tax=Paenibacillus dendritiformis TaxID=130049 RepID=UPI00143DD1A4|nr:response regulator transcription factor [Paenibacillus dendritiformis]MDU5141209.1 response regulator transcription factor [Paenibacillus dendritiformis]NKI21428.1 response regulator transcription factor [Paenibacillus dendritiformis]NRF97580.1 response regulator transcription factor [Paenibacillus dendritiformis]GIO74419.1 putative transcriptional regulatory protein YkoG [Paenibacillus dendritiformis]